MTYDGTFEEAGASSVVIQCVERDGLCGLGLQASIRKELNDFKSAEMDVHDESRHLTRSVASQDQPPVQ